MATGRGGGERGRDQRQRPTGRGESRRSEEGWSAESGEAVESRGGCVKGSFVDSVASVSGRSVSECVRQEEGKAEGNKRKKINVTPWSWATVSGHRASSLCSLSLLPSLVHDPSSASRRRPPSPSHSRPRAAAAAAAPDRGNGRPAEKKAKVNGEPRFAQRPARAQKRTSNGSETTRNKAKQNTHVRTGWRACDDADRMDDAVSVRSTARFEFSFFSFFLSFLPRPALQCTRCTAS